MKKIRKEDAEHQIQNILDRIFEDEKAKEELKALRIDVKQKEQMRKEVKKAVEKSLENMLKKVEEIRNAKR